MIEMTIEQFVALFLCFALADFIFTMLLYESYVRYLKRKIRRLERE